MYKLVNDYLTGQPRAVFCADGNKAIPFDESNTDYQAYLKWLAEGNEPEPADEPQA